MTNPPAGTVPSANDSDLLHLRRSFVGHLAGRPPDTRHPERVHRCHYPARGVPGGAWAANHPDPVAA